MYFTLQGIPPIQQWIIQSLAFCSIMGFIWFLEMFLALFHKEACPHWDYEACFSFQTCHTALSLIPAQHSVPFCTEQWPHQLPANMGTAACHSCNFTFLHTVQIPFPVCRSRFSCFDSTSSLSVARHWLVTPTNSNNGSSFLPIQTRILYSTLSFFKTVSVILLVNFLGWNHFRDKYNFTSPVLSSQEINCNFPASIIRLCALNRSQHPYMGLYPTLPSGIKFAKGIKAVPLDKVKLLSLRYSNSWDCRFCRHQDIMFPRWFGMTEGCSGAEEQAMPPK